MGVKGSILSRFSEDGQLSWSVYLKHLNACAGIFLRHFKFYISKITPLIPPPHTPILYSSLLEQLFSASHFSWKTIWFTQLLKSKTVKPILCISSCLHIFKSSYLQKHCFLDTSLLFYSILQAIVWMVFLKHESNQVHFFLKSLHGNPTKHSKSSEWSLRPLRFQSPPSSGSDLISHVFFYHFNPMIEPFYCYSSQNRPCALLPSNYHNTTPSSWTNFCNFQRDVSLEYPEISSIY